MEKILDKISPLFWAYGLQFIGAIIILVAGWIAAGLAKKFVKRLLVKARTDAAVISFVGHLTYFLILTFAVLAALAKFGVQTASLITVLGAAGLAIGLALQSTLANFAAGVLILIIRPFRIGDYIEGAGVAGTVKEIELFTTVLATLDNIKILVPNGKLFGDVIRNISGYDSRRIDLVVGIGYGSPIGKAVEILGTLTKEDSRILPDPPPQIAVSELADSSVNLAFRPWVRKEDYWDVRFDLIRKIKESFDRNGIEIPFPQRVVHHVSEKAIQTV
jgi:small conductance mechanosensitive channel